MVLTLKGHTNLDSRFSWFVVVSRLSVTSLVPSFSVPESVLQLCRKQSLGKFLMRDGARASLLTSSIAVRQSGTEKPEYLATL